MAAECRWCYHNILSLFAPVFADPKDIVLEGHVCIRFYHKCKIIMFNASRFVGSFKSRYNCCHFMVLSEIYRKFNFAVSSCEVCSLLGCDSFHVVRQ